MYRSEGSAIYCALSIICIFVDGFVALDKNTYRPTSLADDTNVPEDSKTVVEKDDKQWNPKGVRLTDNPADWPGHMKAFGSTGRARNVESYKQFPKPLLFFNDFVAPNFPLLMRNASRINEAFADWSNDSYFLNLPHTHIHWTPTTNISFNVFMQQYKEKGLIYQDELPYFLSDHVPMPSPLLCDSVWQVLSNVILYIGGQEQRNRIDQRNDDTLRCVYAGSQDIVLVSQMDFGKKMPGDFQSVDVTQVDYVKYPSLREVEYVKAFLKQGDCIYIPTKWYWQVNSSNNSKSVDVTWNHKVKSVESAQCLVDAGEPSVGKAIFSELKSWATAWKDVVVHYFSSYLMARTSFDLKVFSQAIMKDQKLFKNITVWNDEYDEITQEVFTILDINRDQNFSMADLEALSPEILNEIRGHLEDRMADYQDVMNDQQLELQEDRTNILPPKDGLPIIKPGEDPKLAVENYINNYLKVLEDVITESIDELTVTGKVPDFKEKLASRQAEIDGVEPFTPKSKERPTTGHKTAKEEAKAKIKAQQEKKKAGKPADGDEDKFSEAEVYTVVDDSIEEEILADDEGEDVGVKQTKKEVKHEVKKKPGSQQQSKSKTNEKSEDKEKKKSESGQSNMRKEGKVKKPKKEKKRTKEEL